MSYQAFYLQNQTPQSQQHPGQVLQPPPHVSGGLVPQQHQRTHQPQIPVAQQPLQQPYPGHPQFSYPQQVPPYMQYPIPYQAGVNQPVYVNAQAVVETSAATAANSGAPLNTAMHAGYSLNAANYPQMMPMGPYFISPHQQVFNTPPPHIQPPEQHGGVAIKPVSSEYNETNYFSAAVLKHQETFFKKPETHAFASMSLVDRSASADVVQSEPTAVGAERSAPPAMVPESVATPSPGVVDAIGQESSVVSSDAASVLAAAPEPVEDVQKAQCIAQKTEQQQPPPPPPPPHKTPSPANVSNAPNNSRPAESPTGWRSNAGQRSNEKVHKKKSQMCYYCQLHGKPEEEYKSHNTLEGENNVVCRLLQSHGCKECGKTGDEAHPEIYCPNRKDQNVHFEQFALEVFNTVYPGGNNKFHPSSGGPLQSGGGHGHHYGGGGMKSTYTNSLNRGGPKNFKRS